MMRAFGDSNSQNRDSIILVEKIVLQQLRGILNEVINLAYKRTGNIIPYERDFEFLMRSPATRRFRKYMRTVNRLKTEQKSEVAHNFLNGLLEDQSDDEHEIYDAEKVRRIFRADRVSQVLNRTQYEEFQKSRAWSSNAKNKTEMIRKLVEILQLPKEIQDHSNCLEIILYLAQETVARIVDFSILTRLDTSNHITDLQPISSSITNNTTLHLCPDVTQGRGMDGIKAVTVQEIYEAIRRVQTMSTRRMGTSFRSSDTRVPFLAL